MPLASNAGFHVIMTIDHYDNIYDVAGLVNGIAINARQNGTGQDLLHKHRRLCQPVRRFGREGGGSAPGALSVDMIIIHRMS